MAHQDADNKDFSSSEGGRASSESFASSARDEALSAAEKGLEAAREALEAAERKLAEAQRQAAYERAQRQAGQEPIDVDPVTCDASRADAQPQSAQAAQPTPDPRQNGYASAANRQGGYNTQGASQQNAYQQPYVQPHYTAPVASRDHVAAGLLALFLGPFGVHKFYLDYNTQGFILLAISLLGGLFSFGLVTGVVWVISIVEGIIYLTKAQSEFERIYVYDKREWF